MMDNKEARRMAIIEQTLEGKFKNQHVAELLHCVNRNVAAMRSIM
jgi:hypothetical protein